MRVALLTIQDDGNFGNRLQNYALQTVLEKRGANVTNLDDSHTKPISSHQKKKEIIKFWLGVFGSKYYKKSHKMVLGREERNKVLLSFSNSYIHNRVKVTHTNVPDNFDLGIVGSDQVWHHWDVIRNPDDSIVKNPDGTNRLDPTELPYYYLEFLPSEKRASYAASFGFTEFPEEDLNEHIQGLKGMKYISCREQSGCDLVKSVIGGDVPHVLDPTLLLSASEWRELEKNVNETARAEADTPYVFGFFLGNCTDEYREEIEERVKEQGQDTKVIDFSDITNKKIASYGPIEFLYLIDHAEYVFTDSFHCTVFSILFGKQFLSFRRQQEGFLNMFGRIEELLKMTGKEECAYGGIDKGTVAEDFETIKKRSLDYLDMVLANTCRE